MRFRGLPAGSKVRIVKASGLATGDRGAWTEISQAGEPIRFTADRGSTVEFEHPHFEPAQWNFEFDSGADGISNFPPLSSGELEPKLKTGPSHLLWFIFVYQWHYGLVISVLTVAGLAVGLLLARTQRANREKRAHERKREDMVATSDRSDPLVGTTLGTYFLVDVLGQGGMATVYKAVPEDSLDGTQMVAVKLVQKQYAENPEFRARFSREVRVSKSLSHPNIIRVQGWGDQSDLLYLVLEFVKGRTLDQLIPPQGWTLEQAAPYILPLLEALAYAHSRNVVHRDLKPDNIMVTDSGMVKVMDFGLARSQDVSQLTKTGNALGTPSYMPPEQITGVPPHPSADQYSLGVVFFEIFCGRRPFVADTPMNVIFKHLSEAPPDPLSLRPDLPPTLARIILRMLEKNPNQRFESLTVVKEGLEALLSGVDWALPEPPVADTSPAKPIVTPASAPSNLDKVKNDEDTVV